MSRPLRLLYVAAGIPAPGTVGGSTHVLEVAGGLARRGHEVVTVAGRATTSPPPDWPIGARIVNVPLPKALSLVTLPVVWREGERLRPDVVMERSYNLAGTGLLYARRHALPAVLEVNAPLWDPPGSPKHRLDQRLPGQPLKRWARWQARAAARVVTPLPEAVTVLTEHHGIVELPWGANTDLFHPAVVPDAERRKQRIALGIPPEATVAVFAGSFRRWHGVESLLRAAGRLLAERADLHLLLIGQGERWDWARALADQAPYAGRVTLTGALPYEEMPARLALADFSVAPFDLSAHAPLQQVGFFWSPLKVFEAMAMALPVVVPDIERLTTIARNGLEARTFAEGDLGDLARAIAWLADHPAERAAMGARARERAVTHYSWAAHCRALENLLTELVEERAGVTLAGRTR